MTLSLRDNVTILIDNIDYGGWIDISITRSIQSIANGFELSVSDKWGDLKIPRPIQAGADCKILIDDQPFLTGFVDTRTVELSGGAHSVKISGRDKAANLVDCSVDLGKWEFRNIVPLVFLNKITAQFGISIILGTGVTIPLVPEKKISVTPGDTAFDVIDRFARFANALPVSDGLGNVVLFTPGLLTAPVTLEEGVNILSISAEYSQKDRYEKYVVLAQQYPSDTVSGPAATQIRGEATDRDLDREDRVLLITAERVASQDKANERADWESKVRAARGDKVSVTVQGWHPNASPYIWRHGDLVTVISPTVGIAGLMLISDVTLKRGNDGTFAELSLIRPDAFSQVHASERTWKRS